MATKPKTATPVLPPLEVKEPPAPETTEQRLVRLQGQRATKVGQLDEVELRWAESPSAVLKEERAALRDEVARLDILVRAAEQRLAREQAESTEEAKRARSAALDRAMQEALDGLAKIGALDAELGELIDALGRKLHARQEIADANCAAAFTVVKHCVPTTAHDHVRRNGQEALIPHLTLAANGAALADRMFAAGIGRLGVALPTVEVRPARAGLTMDEAAAKAQRNVGITLGKLIRARKQRIEQEA